VHAAITRDDVEHAAVARPDAHLVVHPECGCIGGTADLMEPSALLADRTYVLSTGGMLVDARDCDAGTDLVATEVGMLHRLRRERPDMEFLPVRDDAVCDYMKSITLGKLYRSLRDDVERVIVPEPTASRAREAVERMLAVSR